MDRTARFAWMLALCAACSGSGGAHVDGPAPGTTNLSWQYTGSTAAQDGFNGFDVLVAEGALPNDCSGGDEFLASPYQGKYTLGLSGLTADTLYGARICTRRNTPGGVVHSPGLTTMFQTAAVAVGSDGGAPTDAGADAAPQLPPKPNFVSCDTSNLKVRWSGTAPLYHVVEKATPIDTTCGGGSLVVDVAGTNSYNLSVAQSRVVYICGFDGTTLESAPLKVNVKVPFNGGAATCTVL